VTPGEETVIERLMRTQRRVASFIEDLREQGFKVAVDDDGAIHVELSDKGEDHGADLP